MLQDDGWLGGALRRELPRRDGGTAEADNHCRLLKVTDAFNSEKELSRASSNHFFLYKWAHAGG